MANIEYIAKHDKFEKIMQNWQICCNYNKNGKIMINILSMV